MTTLATIYDKLTDEDWELIAKGWRSSSYKHFERALLPFVSLEASVAALSARNVKFHFGNSATLRRVERLRKKLKRGSQQGELRHNCKCGVCLGETQDVWPRTKSHRMSSRNPPNFQQMPSRNYRGYRATTLIIDDIVTAIDNVGKSMDECVLSWKHFQEATQYLRKNDVIRTGVSI